MCGRFLLTSPLDAVRRAFGVTRVAAETNFAPRYNIAPTQPVWAVRVVADTQDAGQRELVPLRWGLMPPWMEEPPHGRPLINARAETVAEKPAFRAAYRRRRCLVPADGWYEWQASAAGGPKQPFLIRPRAEQRRPFAFAGLWEGREGAAGEAEESVAILTMPAVAELASIHPRMPMVLDADAHDGWLDPASTRPGDPLTAFATMPGEAFETIPVSTRVNRVANDDPGLLEPAPAGGKLL